MKIPAIILPFLLLLSYSPPERIPYFHKKVKRIVKKHWKDKAIILRELMIEDDVPKYPNRHVFRLMSNQVFMGYYVISKTFGCQIGGCSGEIASHQLGGTYEEFYYGVILDKEIKIKKIDILDYPSDYGFEICAKSWLKQFNQKYACNELSDFDGISGATVSANALQSDLIDLCWLLSDK